METRRLLSHRLHAIEEVNSFEELSVSSREDPPPFPRPTPPSILSIDHNPPLHEPLLDNEILATQRPATVVTPTHHYEATPTEPYPSAADSMHRPRNNVNGRNPHAAGVAGPAVVEYEDDNNEEGNPDRENLFNYDDEEEVVEREPEQELTWRLDPVVSLSDWTIRVFNRETRQPESYFVHKNVLAVGPRKSEFFVRYFLSHDNLNSNQTSSDIWLESVASEVMPQFLDYIYSTSGELEIDTESAVGLRHLAQYFGNRVMHQKVMKFITDDLTMDNVLTYYQHSVPLDDEKVSTMASNKCSENILSIDKSNELLMHIDPSFFRRIMSSPTIDSKEKQYHISILLAQYCLLNRAHLDDQDFTRLTSDRYLPLVHYDAALILMEMEADLVVSNEENGVISNLQERCIKDLVDNWPELSLMRRDEVLRVLRKLQSGVVADLLVKALSKAKTMMDRGIAPTTQREKTLQTKTAATKSKGAAAAKKEYEEKMADMEKKHTVEMDKLKDDFEKNLLKLRDVALEKEKTITRLKEELARFERMPNQPGGRIMQSGEAQKPDTLPSMGEYAEDGLVLSKPKGQGKYALFFYKGSATNGAKPPAKGTKPKQ